MLYLHLSMFMMNSISDLCRLISLSDFCLGVHRSTLTCSIGIQAEG